MDTQYLKPGMSIDIEKMVTENDTANVVGSGSVNVLATPVLIAWVEEASSEIASSALEDGLASVGTLLEASHLAPTPVGMKVRITSTLARVEGRRLIFRFEAYDEREKISEGTHERFIVQKERFESKALAKRKVVDS